MVQKETALHTGNELAANACHLPLGTYFAWCALTFLNLKTSIGVPLVSKNVNLNFLPSVNIGYAILIMS